MKYAEGADKMRRETNTLTDISIIGLVTGLVFFIIEMSVRLIYLYFWTTEQAPAGYGKFLIYYAFFGLLTSLGISQLKVYLTAFYKNRKGGSHIRIIVSIVVLLLLGGFLLLKMLKTTKLSMSVVIPHMGMFLFLCTMAGIIVLLVIRLKKRFGTKYLLVGFGIFAAVFLIAHAVFLQSFSRERGFNYLPGLNTEKSRPNVLLLSVDTLRFDRLGAYGNTKELSPNIDKLTSESVLFENAISQASWTRASFGSLLTSKYPSQHGAFTVNDPANGGYQANFADVLYDSPLDDNMETMAEIFKDQGYTTIALQSNWHVSEAQNFDQGFQYFLYESLFTISMWDRSYLGVYGKWVPAFFGLKRKLPFWEVFPPADEVYKAFNDIATKGFPKPFFMWINFMDPHSPYTKRENGASIESASVTASYDGFDSDIPVSKASEAYNSDVKYVDHYIGKVFSLMKDKGVLDNTIIVFLSDHGEAFGEHQVEIKFGKTVIKGRHHGHSLYNELVHVPMIIRYPSEIPKGLRIKEQVRLIDVMPTILELSGNKKVVSRKKFEGKSMLPLILNRNNKYEPRLAFSERNFFGLEQKSIQDGRYKLILHTESGDQEYYDLTKDPGERNNLVKSQNEAMKPLHNELHNWIKKMGPLIPDSSGSSQRVLREREKDRLKALGYAN